MPVRSLRSLVILEDRAHLPHFPEMTDSAAAGAIDPFFELVHDGQRNACIGTQGSAVNYVDGYMEAARELVAAVIEKRMVSSRDTLAMPILYNCRHALELSLKFAIDRLHAIGAIAQPHPTNHDILSHWTHLRDANVGDARLVELVGELEPFVVSLASIDDDGQELRFATNRDGARSLNGIAVVNLRLIRRSIEALHVILERLKFRLFDLEEERSTGSHTNECSRADLEEIARVLGDHASWRAPEFEEKKRLVMDRFGLSSRKFSTAVTTIRHSRPLAAMVGLESDLLYLSDEKAVEALALWAVAHPVRVRDPNDLGLDYFNRDWERFEKDARATQRLVEGTLALLTDQELSDLEVLFYVGRDRVQGEHYDEMLKDTLSKHDKATSRWEGAHHIMQKMNLLDCVAEGAAKVGRPTLADKLRAIRPG